MKSQQGNREPKVNAISGSKKCKANCHTDRACYDDGYDYYGPELKVTRGTSLEECSCACKEEAKCKFWTWAKSKYIFLQHKSNNYPSNLCWRLNQGKCNFSRNLGGSTLESPQHRAILYIRLLLHGLILGGFKQNWWPEYSPLPVHLVYESKNATTDVSEPISRFGYVRDSSYSAVKVTG